MVDNQTLAECGNKILSSLYEDKPKWAIAGISKYDSDFLAGIITEFKPRKVLEVGVASGWSSACILKTLYNNSTDYSFFAVDIAERFFCDENYATGQVVTDIIPELISGYSLITKKTISESISSIGNNIDLAFIDAHHMHPWATLDFITILPFLKHNSMVLLHDISLCLKEDQMHQNRGPKYLYDAWRDYKICSIEKPSMIGALLIEQDAKEYLGILLDLLYYPFELEIEQKYIDNIVKIIEEAFGLEWGGKFRRALEIGNYHYNLLRHALSPVQSEEKEKEQLRIKLDVIKKIITNEIDIFGSN